MKELDAYVAAEAAVLAAKKELAGALGIDPGSFGEVQDARDCTWAIEKYRGFAEVGFAPDEATLIAALKIGRFGRSPGNHMGVRVYPQGYSGGQLLRGEPDDRTIVRRGEYVGLMLDDEEPALLMVVRADREVVVADDPT